MRNLRETLEIRHTRYEQMVRDLYRYRVGTISFLELLDTWEQALGIPSPAHHPNREKECKSSTKGGSASPSLEAG